MPAVLFLVETFGVPILAGWLGASLIWVVLGALAVSAMNVATGWRAGAAGPLPSVLVGACFSLIVAVPVFYLAGWLASGPSGG